MQPGQVREQFSQVKRCIDNATRLCRSTKDVPDEVRASLGELGRESEQALHAVEQAENEQGEQGLDRCVDRLEQLGDRMMDACKQSGSVDWDVQSAVRDAHDAIAELKHRLH